MKTTRRTILLGLTAVPFTRAAIQVGNVPLGLELYSLRRQMSQDVPATLEIVRSLGFTDVEVPQLYKLSAGEFRKHLDAKGLSCSSMVANDDLLKPGTQKAIDDAHTLGAKYVIYPWIPHSQTGFSMDDCQRAAKSFNEWGHQFKNAGLSFCYHPHGYEFGPSPSGTLLDTLINGTDKNTVNYQMDVFWVAWAGQDPVAYLKKYPGRFPLVHLKDLRKGAHGNQAGTAPDTDSVPLGTGSIDLQAVFQAAKSAGVQRYYIEDEHPSAQEQIAQSLRYLRSL